jgi:hypothetical protein
MNYLNMRVGVLRRLGDLEGAGTGAAEVLATHARKFGPEGPQVLQALASLADIRRHQGATDEARTLFARLHDVAQRALDSMKQQTDPDPMLVQADLSAESKWAEVLARNLGRPGRSDRSALPPGTPGGPPRIDAPFQARSPVADGRIEPGEYRDGEGLSFDFAKDPNPGGSYLNGDEKSLALQRIKDPSDLSVQMHTVHTATALFLAFRVRDQSVRATPAAPDRPFWNDCVEVYLDGDRVANDFTPILRGNREGFQVGADALGHPYHIGAVFGYSRWKVGASRMEDGYVIEFEVPLELIDTQDGPGFRPATTGSELRMNVSILDYDEPANQPASYGVLWSEDRQWSLAHGGEDFWPVALRLTPAQAPHR